MKEFKFPDIGEGINEGRVTKRLIEEGDFIKEHQVVAEVETDKAVSEILSPFEGKVVKVNFKEGDNIYLQEAVGDEVLATPGVGKLAKDLGIDLTKIKGSGPGGRIIEKDIQNIAEQKEIKKKRKYDFWGYVDYIPLNNIRRVTALHMTQSWSQAPQVTIMDMFNIRELIKFKGKREKQALEQGVKLTYLPFIMKDCCKAMVQYPLLNSAFDPENQEVIVKKYYNGSPGGTFATPIINYPEAAILGIGKITDNKLPLSLTFDHRILDGAYAVRFLNEITSFLQQPDKI